MGWVKPPKGQDESTIDFRLTPAIRTLAFKDRLGFGAVAFVRGISCPIEGLSVRSPQITAAIHESETFRMDWRSADSDRLHSNEIARGQAHVGDGRLPFWFRSQASPSFFAIAMDVAFVKQIWEMEFGRADDFESRPLSACATQRSTALGCSVGKNLAKAASVVGCMQKALARRWRYIFSGSTEPPRERRQSTKAASRRDH